jgi:sigma-B regulation protein RsbU (phosphoserine phosphatase)
VKQQTPTSRSESDILPLFELSTIVNSSLDLSFILGTLLLTIMGKLMVSKAAVLLKKKEGNFVVQYGKGIPKEYLMAEVAIKKSGQGGFAVKRSAKNALLTRIGIHRMFPIVTHGSLIGYCGVSENATVPVAKEQFRFVETLINISAAAIEKSMAFDEIREVNRKLDGRIQQLKTLFELGKDFSGILERDQLVRLFSLTLMGQIGTNRFAICLKEGESIYSRIAPENLETVKNLVCQMVTAPMLTEEIPGSKKFAVFKEHLKKDKIAALIPLQMYNQVKGVLCLGERLRGGHFVHDDLEYIFSLANLAFVSLENARLFIETVEKRKLESDLLIAREIQQRLLPRELPSVGGFDIVASNISSKQVGGDYYDVIPTNDGQVVLAIGDVSGKGTPASLLMANVQATVHALVPFNLALSQATARINDLIHKNTSADKFITFFWGRLDPVRKRFTYVNAGHNPPVVVRADGSVERLSHGGLILGVMKTIVPYQEGTIDLHPGDMIVFYTDGVSEAMDARGNDYTEERLESLIKGLSSRPAEEVHRTIIEEIQSFSTGAPQSDDITLLVLKTL